MCVGVDEEEDEEEEVVGDSDNHLQVSVVREKTDM